MSIRSVLKNYVFIGEADEQEVRDGLALAWYVGFRIPDDPREDAMLLYECATAKEAKRRKEMWLSILEEVFKDVIEDLELEPKGVK